MGKKPSKNAIGMAMPPWKGLSMPIYEFKCPKCEVTVEQAFNLYSDHTIWCQPCQVPMNKQFASPGVIFKGDGWAGKTN